MPAQNPSYQTITEQDYTAMSGPDWPSYADFAQGIELDQFVIDELDNMLRETAINNQRVNNFCVLPFYAVEYPANVACCLLPKDVDLKSVQQNMLVGQRPQECSACWILEDRNLLSDRLIKNRTLDYYTDIDITQLFKQAEQNKHAINHYKVAASNFCNSTCVTCNSNSSTAWGELEQAYKGIDKHLWNIKPTDDVFDIDYKSAKFISFTGGESTMIRAHWDIVEQLHLAGNHTCCLSFVTNGSFNLTSRQIKLLSKFSNVNFCFSIDGIGPVFEYLRYPLSWSKIEQNIKFCQDHNIMVSASYTISNLNIYYHDITVNWFQTKSIPYNYNLVYTPTYFRPTALTLEIKQKILLKKQHPNIVSLLSQPTTEQDQTNYAEFRKQLQLQDQMKNISIEQYLPELFSLF
jgi:hypothetical protein